MLRIATAPGRGGLGKEMMLYVMPRAPLLGGLSPQVTGGVYTNKKRLPLVIGEDALLIADYFELG